MIGRLEIQISEREDKTAIDSNNPYHSEYI